MVVNSAGGTGSLWACLCAYCGKFSEKTSALLRAQRWKGHDGCHDCGNARKRIPDAERVCWVCERRAKPGERQIRECEACSRRATRNGRDADGRPLGRVVRAARHSQRGWHTREARTA